ncbi:hypothetical protein PF001_g14178 [Phytophthora fragariae]|uniref:Uncharacterized protein n=1 Tax=Phytophthora fragariae TaxID=53985 RepID=A0A6A4D8N3_9STRA|nr:hypothetical protein PF001_g14178 [Phytophthora fragariae]
MLRRDDTPGNGIFRTSSGWAMCDSVHHTTTTGYPVSDSMPLASVTLVLHSKLANRAPDIVTTIVSDFLLPDLTLAHLCQLAPVGSTSLLDLVWLRSLRDAKSAKWTAAKLLQSEPHYNRWEFSQAMLQAVGRGDLVMLQWLLAHFPGCPVSSEVVEEAARGGHLWVLQLLEADRTHGGIEWSDRSVDEAARSGKWELVRWLLRRTGSTKEARRADDDVVNCAFEQNNLVEVKWAIERGFRVRSITFPDCVEAEWQGRAEILRYLLDGGHVPVANIGGIAAYRAARFGALDFIKWLASTYKELIDVQYWTHAAENASEGGHLSVVQWVFMNVGGIARGNGPSVAMFAAAENGKVDVVEWLYKQYGSKLNVELFQELAVPTDAGDDEEEDMIPTTAMNAAARNGNLCVLKVLSGIDSVSRNKQRKRGGTSKRTQVRQEGHYPLVRLLPWMLLPQVDI